MKPIFACLLCSCAVMAAGCFGDDSQTADSNPGAARSTEASHGGGSPAATRLVESPPADAPETEIPLATEFTGNSLADAGHATGGPIELTDAQQQQLQRATQMTIVAGRHEDREYFDAAMNCRHEVLQIMTSLFGEDNWRTQHARLAIAQTERLATLTPEERARWVEAKRLDASTNSLYQQGQPMQAAAACRQVVATIEALLGRHHPDYARTLNNLGLLEQALGNMDEAKTLIEKGLVIRRQNLGAHHPDCGASLTSLGLLKFSQGDFPGAEQDLKEAVEISRQAFGAASVNYADAQNRLGLLYKDSGNHAGAIEALKAALEARRALHGQKHLACTQSLLNLAAVSRAAGEYQAAEPLLTEALDIYTEQLGAEHVRTVATRHRLGDLFIDMQDYARATDELRQVLAAHENTLGRDDPRYAAALQSLGRAYRDQGQFEQAEPMLVEALKIHEAALGPDHETVADGLESYAQLLQQTARAAEAENLLNRARGIRARLASGDRPLTR